MKFLAPVVCCLFVASLSCLFSCHSKGKAPTMPQISSPAPGPGASPQELERYQLEEEKRSLSEKYGDNIDRIQQINSRLIQLNIEINRQANPHY